GSSATTASSGANAVFSGGASPSSGSQISLVDSVFVLSLPNGVTLAPYHRCDQQALRYVRAASDGTGLSDVMLWPATQPGVKEPTCFSPRSAGSRSSLQLRDPAFLTSATRRSRTKTH